MSHAIEFIETTFFTKQIQTIATAEELEHYKINSLHGQTKATSSKERVGYAKLEWRWVIKEKVAVQGSFIF